MGMWRVFVRIVKGAALLVIAVFLLAVGLSGFALYKQRPLRSFCEKMPPSATAESIVEDAQRQGFIVLGEVSDNATIRILNQRSPFWRIACDVKLKNGCAVSKRVVAAD